LLPNADDCKARDEAKGGSLGEERNDAGAAFGGNPKGRGGQRNGCRRCAPQGASARAQAQAPAQWAHRGVARRLFGM